MQRFRLHAQYTSRTLPKHSFTHVKSIRTMPLVAAGVNDGTAEDKNTQWMNKLVGKKLSDEDHSEVNFCKKDLPEQCRVIAPGTMVTRDFRPDRLNVHVQDDGTVTHVAHG